MKNTYLLPYEDTKKSIFEKKVIKTKEINS